MQQSLIPPPPVDPADEAHWAAIRAQFTVADDFINLENGYFGIQPDPVLAAFARYTAEANAETARFLRLRYPPLLDGVMAELAAFTGAGTDELLITRNATEAMNILAQGYPFRPGDEVLLGDHDYDHVVPIFELLAERKGIVLKRIRLPLHPRDDDEILGCYEAALTPRSRVILATHMIHLTGQILPVAKLSAMARRHGVDVMVDAAHSFAHLDFRLPDLGADFIAVNLHKWLGAPLGSGLMYVARDRLGEIAPIFADRVFARDDIRHLGHFGTTPPGAILAVSDALAFHDRIGSGNKEARLRWLKDYWMDRVADLPGIELLTPRDPARSCAIGAFRIAGWEAEAIVARLYDDHRIFSVGRPIDGGDGVRITPHLYTRPADLDLLVTAIGVLAGRNQA
ncbi:MAG: aminotransferase class V-fold PLP-dependent enzyme [Aliidongia sp.]